MARRERATREARRRCHAGREKTGAEHSKARLEPAVRRSARVHGSAQGAGRAKRGLPARQAPTARPRFPWFRFERRLPRVSARVLALPLAFDAVRVAGAVTWSGGASRHCRRAAAHWTTRRRGRIPCGGSSARALGLTFVFKRPLGLLRLCAADQQDRRLAARRRSRDSVAAPRDGPAVHRPAIAARPRREGMSCQSRSSRGHSNPPCQDPPNRPSPCMRT